jgi:capsule biosynthesis phosphatase
MSPEVKKIIIDIDDTITINSSSPDYATKIANLNVINKINLYKQKGYEIILFSARNMKTYNGEISKINKFTLPILIEWLENNNVQYDGIIMGKPWCGEKGFYVDDKSIRPNEFVNLSEEEINKLINTK